MSLFWTIVTIFGPAVAVADPCEDTVAGAKFLHQRDSRLHTTPMVETSARQQGVTSQNPVDKISAWLESLKTNQDYFAGFINLHVTKPEQISESYFAFRVRLARERGEGELPLTPENRQELIREVVDGQTTSLKLWLKYFLSPDTDFYPTWVKYWALTGLVKLGVYDVKTGTFGKRDRGQVAPFAELNPEAMALVAEALVKRVNGRSLDDIKDEKLLELLRDGASFGKMYGHVLFTLAQQKRESRGATAGKWVKYKMGSDPTALVKSLEGKGTGWCTAGIDVARRQLRDGDFHVYYTYDNDHNPTVPRIAIRMEFGRIGEIRGVAPQQNLDAEIAASDILNEKLKQFGNAEKALYLKRLEHMRQLTELDRVHKNNEPFSKEQLRFLYELDEAIVGFGLAADPRVNEIRSTRKPHEDLAVATGLKPNEISITLQEATKSGVRFHYGDLVISGLSAQALRGTKIADEVHGSLTVENVDRIVDVTFPNKVKGDFVFKGVKDIQNSPLSKFVGGSELLGDLDPTSEAKLSELVGGDLYMTGLTSVKFVIFPKRIGGDHILLPAGLRVGPLLPKNYKGQVVRRVSN